MGASGWPVRWIKPAWTTGKWITVSPGSEIGVRPKNSWINSSPPIASGNYWSTSESEYATDVVFDSAKELEKLYPKFLRHAISSFHSPDVMRFLGRRVPQSGTKVQGEFQGEVTSSLKERAEGVRIRHTLNSNSLKMYDKWGAAANRDDHAQSRRVN
jgi:hypothetical protein